MSEHKLGDVVKTASSVIFDLRNELEKVGIEVADLSHFKLAYAVTAKMVEQEKIDPEDIVETMEHLSKESAANLQSRARILEIEDGADLSIGIPDAESKTAQEATGGIHAKTPNPESAESISTRQQIITNITAG